MKIRNLLKVVLPLLILGTAFSAFSYLKNSKPEKIRPEPREKVWLVDTQLVQSQSQAPLLTLYGEVESQELVQAAATGSGVVQKLYVKVGDQVQKGQLLLALDPRDFELALEQKQAEVRDLKAQLEELRLLHDNNEKALLQEQELLQLAQAEVQRMQRLQTQKLGSESSLSDARAALGKQELAVLNRQIEVRRFSTKETQLQARLQSASAALQQAQLNLQRSEVHAEFNGVISSVAVSAGDRVQSGKILLSLYALDSLEIRARLPARFQQEIQAALAQGETLTGQTANAEPLQLLRLAGEADPGGIDAFFKPLDGPGLLRPGNLLKLDLQRPRLDNVIAIPYPSLYGNNRVYLMRDGRMFGVDVETLGRSRNQAGESLLLIRSAEINDQDRIIITHLPNAINGLKIRDAALPGEKKAPRNNPQSASGQTS